MQSGNPNSREIDAASMQNAALKFRIEDEQRNEDLDRLSSTIDSENITGDSALHFGLDEAGIRDLTGFSLTVDFLTKEIYEILAVVENALAIKEAGRSRKSSFSSLQKLILY